MDPKRNIIKFPKILWIAALVAALCISAATMAACTSGKASAEPAVSLIPSAVQTQPVVTASSVPDFLESRRPINTEESAARYGLMSEREQLACYPWGMLSQRVEGARADTIGPFADSSYTPQQQEAARHYVLDGFEKAGIALPDDARIATDTAGFQDSFDLMQPDGSFLPAKVFTTALITDAAATEENPSAITAAVALELTEDIVTGGDPYQELPRYVTRAVLAPEKPSHCDYFRCDIDGDGVWEYYVGFYRYSDNGVIYDNCYALMQRGDVFDIRLLNREEYLTVWKRNNEYWSEHWMRKGILDTDGYGFSVEELSFMEKLRTEGSYTQGKLYMSVSHQQSATMNMNYRYDEASGASEWKLELAWPEGGTYAGSLKAFSYCAFVTRFAAADLTGDGKEELIVFIYPEMSNTLVEAELHVFSEQDGTLKEILTFIGDSPERSSLVLPNNFRALTPGADAGGLSGWCQGVALIHPNSLTLLRIGAYSGQTTAYTYLWYNYNGQWEVIDQTVSD